MREDKLWEAAIIIECGQLETNMPQPERKRLGKLVSALREIGATPDEIRARAKRYHQVMPKGCKLTLAALVNHWSKLTPQKISTPQASYSLPNVRPSAEGYKQALECLPANLRRKLELKHS